MAGYGGGEDAESVHAIILAENAIHASQQMLTGLIVEDCQECGNEIPKARVEFARKHNMKCMYCVVCQEAYDKAPKIKMLDRIL